MTILNTNFSKPMDDSLYALWKGLFREFRNDIFQRACIEIVRTHKFFPAASEVIEAYQGIKADMEKERLKKLKDQQRLLSDTSGQKDCIYCNNGGFASYMKGGYRYSARCTCSHGHDLNQFSQSQIKRNYIPETMPNYLPKEKAAIKEGRNPFYLPTIREVLNDEEYAVFLATQEAKHQEALEFYKAKYGDVKPEENREAVSSVLKGFGQSPHG